MGVGRSIGGRFELIESLGSGGMGTVWRARDVALEREVALKEVRAPDGGTDEEGDRVRQRALREAKALARLSHPNVVTVHQVIEDETYPWIVMELVPGGSVQDALDQGDMPPREAARIGAAVLAALRAAHEAGVLHRDVKPANVLLGPNDRVLLTDFGIAAMEGTSPLTATGSIIGSPEYLAPERVLGHTPRPEADLWSLGMLLYVAVEGLSPFRRANTMATLGAVLHEPLPAPRRAQALGPIIEALLAKDPADRPSGDALAGALDAVVRGEAVTATMPAGAPPTPPPRPVAPPTVHEREPERRRLLPVIAALAAVALIVGGTVAAIALGGDDPPREKTSSSGPPNDPATTPASSPPESPPETPSASMSPATATSAPPTTRPSASPAATDPPALTRAPTPPTVPMTTGGDLTGTWVAQLASVPKSDGAAKRDAKLAEVRADVPTANVLDSDDHASFKPGFWVVYSEGPFTDGDAALAYCRARGRTSTAECVGRFVSDTPSDIAYICPPDHRSGICRRD